MNTDASFLCGYAAPFRSHKNPDTHGQWFTPNTCFFWNDFSGRILWMHDRREPVGRVMDVDRLTDGWWVLASIQASWVLDYIHSGGFLGWSVGMNKGHHAASRYRNSPGEIAYFPVGEISLAPRPANKAKARAWMPRDWYACRYRQAMIRAGIESETITRILQSMELEKTC